jgi:HEAT repeat protein
VPEDPGTPPGESTPSADGGSGAKEGPGADEPAPPPPETGRRGAAPAPAPRGPAGGLDGAPGGSPPPLSPGGEATPEDRGRRAGGAAKGLERWEYWWEFNKDRFLRRHESGTITPLRAGRRSDPLGALRASLILPALRRASMDRSDGVRAATMFAFGKVGDLGVFGDLYRGTKDRSPEVRKAAMLGLSYLGEKEIAPVFLRCVTDEDEDPEVRAFAAAGLGLLDAPGAVAFVESVLLDHREPAEVRGAIALALGESSEEEARSVLVAVALDDRDDDRVRAMAAASLGRANRLGNAGTLARLLVDRSAEVRRSAALGLGAIRFRGEAQELLDRALVARREWLSSGALTEEAGKALEEAIADLTARSRREEAKVAAARSGAVRALLEAQDRDPDLQVAAFALTSLGEIGGSDAVVAIRKILERRSHRLKAWAGLAAGLTRSPELTPFVVRAFERSGEDPSVRAAMAIGLGLAGDIGSAKRLALAAVDRGEDPDLRGYCLLAAAMTGEPAALAAIDDVLDSKGNPSLHRAAALSLSLVGRSGSANRLVALLRDSNDPFVKAAATIGLGHLREEAATRALAAAAGDPKAPALTRLYGVLALGYAGDVRAAPPALSRLAWHFNYRVRLASLDRLTALL